MTCGFMTAGIRTRRGRWRWAKGDERRIARVDQGIGTVFLEGPKGEEVPWRPRIAGARRGAVEVYRAEGIELRAGDRIRWTHNDNVLGLVNSGVAEVASVRGGRVSFQLEDGRMLEIGKHDPRLRHLDHAWAATVHGFQGRTMDNVIAVMEAGRPHLTTRKTFYVEISRARHGAELITDDARALRERLEAVTGERIAALEAVEPAMEYRLRRKAPGTGARRSEREERRPKPIPSGTMPGTRQRRRNGNRRRSVSAGSRWRCSANQASTMGRSSKSRSPPSQGIGDVLLLGA